MPHTQLERPRSPRSHARGFPTAHEEEEEANPHRCKAPESMAEEKEEEEEAEKEEEEAGKEEEAELHLVRRTQV